MKHGIIRFAKPEDASALAEIYNHYIQIPITFEEKCPSEEEFQARIQSILKNYPYLVCEYGGTPVGYAYAHAHKERAVYRWNAELSIYVHPAYTGRGIGKALYGTLIELLQLQHIQTLYAYVTLPNAHSEHLHQSFGFHLCGTYHHTGYKVGNWHDVGIFEKQIVALSGIPQEPVPITALPANTLHACFKKYNAML